MLVEIEGEEEPVEVSPDQVQVEDDDPFLTQDEVDGIVQNRLNRQENNLRSDLLQSDEFWQEMAQERGVELRDDGMPKGSATDEEIQELRRKASKAESLESELEETQQTIQQARESTLEQDLLDKAPPTANETARETFKREAKSRMTYDEDYGWVKANEDGEPVYEGGEPVGTDGVVSELEDSHSFLFESTSPGGGSDVSPSGSGGTMTQEQFEAEVEAALEANDEERMQELEEMEAEGAIETE